MVGTAFVTKLRADKLSPSASQGAIEDVSFITKTIVLERRQFDKGALRDDGD